MKRLLPPMFAFFTLTLSISAFAKDTWIVLYYQKTDLSYMRYSIYEKVKIRVDENLKQGFECTNSFVTYSLKDTLKVQVANEFKEIPIPVEREYGYPTKYVDHYVVDRENLRIDFGQASHSDLTEPKYLRSIPEVSRDGEEVRGFVCSE